MLFLPMAPIYFAQGCFSPLFFPFRQVTHANYYAPFEIRPDTILLCSNVIKRKIRLVLKTTTDDLGER